MRKQFSLAYEDIHNISQHKDIMTLPPISVQESFMQTLCNIILCNNKEQVGEIINLLNTYKGSFSHLILSLKYCNYCMEKELNKHFSHFNIIKFLAKWVEILEGIKKKKDIRLYAEVIENLELGVCKYEEFIVYLNYISTDLTTLLKSGTEETKKKYPDLANHPHLDPHDLIKFLSVILPKTLTNAIVPRNFFPPTLLKSNDENVDILYSNQTLQNIAQNKSYYNILLRSIIKILLSMELEPSQTKQLILNSFKYYYLFHHDKNYLASQLVIESLKKITSAVRFAISDEISLFLIILKKLGKELFISYLAQKFHWVNDLIKANTVFGINKTSIKPYYSQGFGNSFKLKVDAGKSQNYYIQIYDRFSLFYFCVNCMEYDITIRFYYLGAFNKEETIEDKRLLFSSEKKEKIFEGSIQTVEKGIYMFEFDNTYSWMKGKTVYLDTAILVPLEIKEQSSNPIKQIIFERYENLNEVPFENVIGWIDENEIKINSTSANISCNVEDEIKVYNLKLVKNTGQAFEYQTESKSRFIRKLKSLETDPHIFWLIEGYKVKGIIEIEKWINGEFELQKLMTSSEEKKHEKKQNEEINQLENTQNVGEQKKEDSKNSQAEESRAELMENNENKQEKVENKEQGANEERKNQSKEDAEKQNGNPQGESKTQQQKNLNQQQSGAEGQKKDQQQ